MTTDSSAPLGRQRQEGAHAPHVPGWAAGGQHGDEWDAPVQYPAKVALPRVSHGSSRDGQGHLAPSSPHTPDAQSQGKLQP